MSKTICQVIVFIKCGRFTSLTEQEMEKTVLKAQPPVTHILNQVLFTTADCF